MVNRQEIMGCESVDMVRFDLGNPPSRSNEDSEPSHRKSLARNFLVWSDLTFGPLFQGQMRTAKLKSAYNSFIIGPRGLEW